MTFPTLTIPSHKRLPLTPTPMTSNRAQFLPFTTTGERRRTASSPEANPTRTPTPYPTQDFVDDIRVSNKTYGGTPNDEPVLIIRPPFDDTYREDPPAPALTYPLVPPNTPRPLRKRKAAPVRKANVVQATSMKKTLSKTAEEDKNNVIPPVVNTDKHEVARELVSGVAFTSDYIASVLRTALMLSRFPFGFLLFVFILLFVIGHIQSEFRKVFAPACWIPGIASTPMCFVDSPTSSPNIPKWADYTQLSQLESSTFEHLLDNAASGSSLSIEIKKAEMATADLVVLVAHSDLEGRDILEEHLRHFVNAAKAAGRGLSRLNSRVGGAVDSIIAVNDHTMRTIEAAAQKEASSLGVFRLFSRALTTRQVAATLFNDAMAVLAGHLQRIVVEAELCMKLLDQLEEMLSTLQAIVARENQAVVADKEELLAQLWTMLGGYRRELHSADDKLQLLRRVGWYRKSAYAHVKAMLMELEALREGMEDLRERVTAPELLGEMVPVEMHLKGIQAGLDRLTATRISAQLKEQDVFRNLLAGGSEFEEKLEIGV